MVETIGEVSGSQAVTIPADPRRLLPHRPGSFLPSVPHEISCRFGRISLTTNFLRLKQVAIWRFNEPESRRAGEEGSAECGIRSVQ